MKAGKILLFFSVAALLGGCVQRNDTLSLNTTENKCRACHAFPFVDRLHTAHVDSIASILRPPHFACDLCHPGVNDTLLTVTPGHGRGEVQVHIDRAWDSAGVSFYNPANQTCNLVYCHGYGIQGNSGIVKITDTISGCGFCHNLDTLRNDGHHGVDFLQVPIFNKCWLCHPGDSLLTKATNPATHINGHLDVAGCDQCHEWRTWTGD